MNSFARRIDRLEHRILTNADGSVHDALSQPDFAITLHAAIISASRTSSDFKHAVLAAAVAAQFTSAPDSVHAAASSIAAEAVHRLSKEQLVLLGLIALVWAGDDPSASSGGNTTAPDEQLSATRMDLLPPMISALPTTYRLNLAELAHLVSANVIILDPTIEAHFEVLLSRPQHLDSTHNADWIQAQSIFRTSPAGRRLSELWSLGLQSAIPVPAGMLIGCAAAEHVTNHRVTIGTNDISLDFARRYGLWSREVLDSRITDAIENELDSRQIR